MNAASTLSCFLLGAVGVVAGPTLGVRASPAWSRPALAAAAAHPLIHLGLFYSLATHMHHRLGGWPARIGEAGFPPGLLVHANVAEVGFASLLLGDLGVWPLAVVLCACLRRARPGLRYLGLHALASGAALCLMQLAPDPFLVWWWD